MTVTPAAIDALRGRQVAFTGKLASLTRSQAARLVEAHGGRFAPAISSRTAYLVVGQEGWPLRKDGRLSAKLCKARRLQQRGSALTIWTEDEFLARLHLDTRTKDVRRLHSTPELTRLLQIPREHLTQWLEGGLIHAEEYQHGIAFFDYHQVASAKTLCELVRAGVTVRRIRQSFEQLRTWAGEVAEPLAQLALLEKDGALLVRVGDSLAEPSGQLRLDFDNVEESALPFADQERTADEWFALASQHEEAGSLTEAELGYRQALLSGGADPVACFNLANVLYALGRKSEAAERFAISVELNPECAEAWNNLGIVLSELKRSGEAKVALQRAIDLGHADAHYNLADLLEENGQSREAESSWRAYLQSDQTSPWASYAKKRLKRPS